jgi:hypothetical protein
MWTERQCRDRRIGMREIFWSWAIVALIVMALAAWSGYQALTAHATTSIAGTVSD